MKQLPHHTFPHLHQKQKNFHVILFHFKDFHVDLYP